MTAQLSADSELADDVAGRGAGARSDSLSGAARRTTRLHLPGMTQTNTRSLFVFSEDNFIRKYAQLIIEWGYPFSLQLLGPPYGSMGGYLVCCVFVRTVKDFSAAEKIAA